MLLVVFVALAGALVPIASGRLSALLFLGDVFAIPASWPFANVFSVGDVLIAVGAAYSIHATCGSRLVPARYHRVPTPTLAADDGSPSRSPSSRPNRPDR